MKTCPNPALTLPLNGIAALDASAGTGKTYSIALLHLRLILNGAPIDRVLVSTFTNDAAAELRERLRQPLLQARTACTTDAPVDDPNLQHVLDAAQTTTATATLQARLDHALSHFDLAPICTIHQFCQRLLRDYALELGAVPNSELQPQDPVLDRLVDDFRAAAQWHDAPMPAESVRDTRHLAQCIRDLQLTPDENDRTSTDPTAARQAWRERLRALCTDWQAAWRDHGPAALDALQAAEAEGWITATSWTPAKRKNTQAICEQLNDIDGNNTDQDTVVLASQKFTGQAGFKRLRWTAIVDTFEPGQVQAAECALSKYALFRLSAQWAHELANEEAYLRGAACRRLIHYIHQAQSESEACTFADLIQAVYRQLANADFVAMVRADFDAVLVDECQDTDPQQIAIFHRLFGADAFAATPEKSLVWVGDPKQSIYRFRGADLDTYLHTKQSAQPYTLSANFRSDPPLIAAVNALFSGPTGDGTGLFDDRIPFQPAQPQQPVRLRWADRTEVPPAFCAHTWPFTDPLPAKGPALRAALTDCARQIESLLHSPLEIAQPATATGIDLDWRHVQPGDVAVLGRTHSELEMLRRYLLRRGIPAAYQTDASVFNEPEVRDLSLVLNALARPRPATLRAALTTPLFGYPLATVAALTEPDQLAALTRPFAQWAGRIEQEGVLAVWFAILRDPHIGYGGVPALTRLAGEPSGERTITNIIQLGECLQNAWRTHHARSAEALKDHLDHAIARAANGVDPVGDDTATLRLETDRPTVILATIHAAKGLQYPVVFLPSLWLERADSKKGPPAVVTYDRHGQPSLHLPGDPDWDTVVAEENRQQRAEQMRLLYVALTRAKHQVHIWWGPADPKKQYYLSPLTSTLARLLYDPRRTVPPTSDSELRAALASALTRDPAATFAIYPEADTPTTTPPNTPTQPTTQSTTTEPPRAPTAAVWTRAPLPDGPRQASYSALIRKSAEGYKGEDEIMAEVAVEESAPDAADEQRDTQVPDNGILDGWEAGRVLGDRIHCAFEDAFQQADAAAGRTRFIAALTRDLPALARPLAPNAPPPDPRLTAESLWTAATQAQWWTDGPRLQDLYARPHAPEWTYLLPQSAAFEPASLAAILDAHRGPHPWGDPAYINRVARLDFPSAQGYFEGIIDLFGQLPDGRWALLDYKTNWIENGYAPADLTTTMSRAHYLLQALLYTVAAQRWLRQTTADWQYDRDFAGTVYLFLRGLQADTAHGVWCARPPRDLVDALETTLCGGAMAP